MIDSKLLPSGEPYKALPDMYSIWLLPYDPFGDNRMIYTVKNMVAENNQIVYNIPKERGRYMGIMGVIDYEKRDSYNEGIELGRSEGIQTGIIQGTITTCKSLKQDMKATKSHIMTQFNLTNEKADEYINLYW